MSNLRSFYTDFTYILSTVDTLLSGLGESAIGWFGQPYGESHSLDAVSYTHLDVYKRQTIHSTETSV